MEMTVRPASEFKTPDDMQGFFVWRRGDNCMLGEIPDGMSHHEIQSRIDQLTDEQVLVVPV